MHVPLPGPHRAVRLQLRDIHWIAGLLEGEGCFTNGQRTVRISYNTVDSDVAARVALVLGVIRVYRRGKLTSTGKQVFAVMLSGRRAAGWMMTLYSLMGRRRQIAIRNALKFHRGR